MNRLISLVLCVAVLLCTAGCGKKQDKTDVTEQEVKVSLVTEEKAKKIDENTTEKEKETEEKTEKTAEKNDTNSEVKKSIEKKFVDATEKDKFNVGNETNSLVKWVSTGYSFNVDGKMYFCYDVDYIPECFKQYNLKYETPLELLATTLKDVKTECIKGIKDQVVMEDCGEYKRIEFGDYHDSLELHIYPDKYIVFMRDKSDINAESFYRAVEKYFRINPKQFTELKNGIDMLKNGEIDYLSSDFKSDKSSGYFSYSLMPSEDNSSETKQYSHKLYYYSKG